MTAVFEPVRAAIADAVRTRVAGDVGAVTVAELLADDRPGWFDADAVVRRVHGDAAMFVGGLRALLLQSLHPLAMAGVAQHSDYRADPWGRLQRTADFLARTTYGSAEQAAAACAQVRIVHRRVTGRADDGRPYAANDPHLLAWVHLAEIDSFVSAARRYGTTPLDRASADRYIAEMARVAGELGVVAPPTSVRAMRAELRRYQPELRSTQAAIEAGRYLLNPTVLPVAARPPYAVLAAAAIGLLPWWARASLRLPPVTPLTDRAVQPAMHAMLGLLRWSTDARPSALR
jgi:uncharacterized protein (DUF2236 family)